MKAATPMMMSGAASPIARDRPRIEPVAIPGTEFGSTVRQMVCQRVAPSASEPSRSDCGTALIASREVMIITGRISIDRVSAPVSSTGPSDSGSARDQGQAENAVDHAGNRGEILDVQFDRAVVPTGAVGVLLQVDRRHDADRDGDDRGQHHEPERADDGGLATGRLGSDLGGLVEDQVEVQARPGVSDDDDEQYGEEDDAHRKAATQQRAERDVGGRLLVRTVVGREWSGGGVGRAGRSSRRVIRTPPGSGAPGGC